MPPVEDVQRHLLGVWRMMIGRRDGVRLLDVSIDGFWNSFFAIAWAAPAMLAGWAPLANEMAGPDSGLAARLFIVARLAVVDIGSWVLPIVGLAALAGTIGIRDRFVHYVVASNWASVIFAWFMLPGSLLRLISGGGDEFATALSLGIFLASLVLSWRLADAALGKGPGVTTGVFTGMLFASILTLFTLQDLLRLGPPA